MAFIHYAKDLPPHTHMCTHMRVHICVIANWVPVDVAHPCEREAVDQANRGMQWADLRWGAAKVLLHEAV